MPVLKAELKKKSEECDGLLKEKVGFITPGQCQDQYWAGICDARRIFAKNMPEFDWETNESAWLASKDHEVEC